MKTVKVIHYPEGGNKTTEIFEADNVKIVEGYLHEVYRDHNIEMLLSGQYNIRTFGGRMDTEKPTKYWIMVMYLDNEAMFAGMNSKVYVMVDGKTVASYESIIID